MNVYMGAQMVLIYVYIYINTLHVYMYMYICTYVIYCILYTQTNTYVVYCTDTETANPGKLFRRCFFAWMILLISSWFVWGSAALKQKSGCDSLHSVWIWAPGDA